MASTSRYSTGVALSVYWLMSSLPVLAQSTWGGNGPVNTLGVSADVQTATDKVREAEGAARELAFRYLDFWSSPKQVTLSSASPFYAPQVIFHSQKRKLAAVVAEKQRFAQRWPKRTYRHRPGTTQVHCEADAARCTVRSSFDFEAANTRKGQRSRGLGEHELVITFAGGEPRILAENSQVIIRGQGNMTELLGESSRTR